MQGPPDPSPDPWEELLQLDLQIEAERARLQADREEREAQLQSLAALRDACKDRLDRFACRCLSPPSSPVSTPSKLQLRPWVGPQRNADIELLTIDEIVRQKQVSTRAEMLGLTVAQRDAVHMYLARFVSRHAAKYRLQLQDKAADTIHPYQAVLFKERLADRLAQCRAASAQHQAAITRATALLQREIATLHGWCCGREVVEACRWHGACLVEVETTGMALQARYMQLLGKRLTHIDEYLESLPATADQAPAFLVADMGAVFDRDRKVVALRMRMDRLRDRAERLKAKYIRLRDSTSPPPPFEVRCSRMVAVLAACPFADKGAEEVRDTDSPVMATASEGSLEPGSRRARTRLSVAGQSQVNSLHAKMLHAELTGDEELAERLRKEMERMKESVAALGHAENSNMLTESSSPDFFEPSSAEDILRPLEMFARSHSQGHSNSTFSSESLSFLRSGSTFLQEVWQMEAGGAEDEGVGWDLMVAAQLTDMVDGVREGQFYPLVMDERTMEGHRLLAHLAGLRQHKATLHGPSVQAFLQAYEGRMQVHFQLLHMRAALHLLLERIVYGWLHGHLYHRLYLPPPPGQAPDRSYRVHALHMRSLCAPLPPWSRPGGHSSMLPVLSRSACAHFPYLPAVPILDHLPFLMAPTDHLMCLSLALQEIVRIAENHVQPGQSPSRPTADTLFPIVVWCLVHADVWTPNPLVQFLANHVAAGRLLGVQGYCLATFEAAVHHVTTELGRPDQQAAMLRRWRAQGVCPQK